MFKFRFFVGMLFTLTIFAVLSSAFVLEYQKVTIENYAREQARNIVDSVASCVNEEVNEHGIKNVDLATVIHKCGGNLRSGGETGDMFVVNLANNEFVYDGSRDCSTGEQKKFDNQLCTLFSKPETCEKAIKVMKSGYSSTKNTKLTWQFDDDIEYLEWTIVPNETNGFYGPTGIGGFSDKNNTQLLVAIGTQKDELFNHFKYLHIFQKISVMLVNFILLFSIAMLFTMINIITKWQKRQ